MRPLGGPTTARNAIGRWQDRREDRLERPYGEARQASWLGIAGLVVALVLVVAVVLYAFLYFREHAEGGLGPVGREGRTGTVVA